MPNIHNSVLSYNGVEIPYIKTDVFSQEPVWSPDGTDLLYLHIRIGVSGVLNACFLGGLDPADWIEQNRPLLLQRGNALFFFVGGTQVLPSAIGNGTVPTTGKELVSSPIYFNPSFTQGTAHGIGTPTLTDTDVSQDAKLGPKPIRLDIRAIRGGGFSIYYEIETWIPYCWSGGVPSTILSNRWDSTIDIDDDYYRTRTINGTLILNGQYLEDRPAPETLARDAASLIFPPTFKNWRRKLVKFTLSSDQLTVNYSIVDRQQYVAMQHPAVHIDATYAEVSPAPGASGQSGTNMALLNYIQVNMDVTVTGDPGVYMENSYPTTDNEGRVNPDKLKYELMKIMFQVVFSRIQFPFSTVTKGNEFKDTNEFITHFELREDLMKPVVGCRVIGLKTRQLSSGPANSPAAWQSNVFDLTNVGQPLLLNDMIAQVSTQPASIDNWATYLLLCSVAPKNPCDEPESPTVVQQYYTATSTAGSSQTGTSQAVTGSGYQTVNNLSFSQANYKFPFTEYTATVDYVTDNHILQLPTMYDVEQDTPGTTKASSVFCQTASPTSQKIIHWKASRLGAWPMAPKPDAVDVYGGSFPTDKMLEQTFSAGEVELSNDGLTRHYSIAGIYRIGMARRVQWDVANTVLSTICNTVIGSSVYGDVDASYPTANFIDGILNPGTSPGAS